MLADWYLEIIEAAVAESHGLTCPELPVGREPSEVARDLDKQIEFLFIEIAC